MSKVTETTVIYKYQEMKTKHEYRNPSRGLGRFHIIKETTESSDVALSCTTIKRIGQAYSQGHAILIVMALNNLEVEK